MSLSRLSLFGPLLLLACAQPPDIAGDIETYANARTDANTSSCDCPQLLGYADSIQCDDALGPLGTNARDCMASVLDGHEEAARDYLACAGAAYQAFAECLRANVSCEAKIFDDCTNDRDTALASCPLMQANVQSAFAACAG